MQTLNRVRSTGSRLAAELLTLGSGPTGGASFIGQSLSTHVSDPFMPLIPFFRNQVVESSVEHASTPFSSWRTNTISRSYQYGFSMIRRLFFGERRVSGNWKPYTRISMYGTVFPFDNASADYVTLTGITGLQPGTNHGSFVFNYVNEATKPSLPFEELTRFGRYLISDRGSSFLSFRKDPNGRETRCTVSGLKVTENEISYHAAVEHKSLPISANYGFRWNYHVSIRRDVNGAIDYSIPGIQTVTGFGGPASGTNKANGRYHQHLNIVSLPPNTLIGHFARACGHSIIGARPGLNTTQGRAISELLAKVSENLETLMESPGLPELFKGLVGWPRELWLQFGRVKSLPARALLVIEAVSKGTLTWKFALEPTIKSLNNALTHVRQIPRKTESSIVFSSDETPLEDLPFDLQEYILPTGVEVEDVAEYKITLHSETSMNVTNRFLAAYFGGLLGKARQLGVSPEPLVIWKLQAWSFVFDWFVPMSSYIATAQSYFQSYTVPLTTLGHSVYVWIRKTDGYCYAIYIRSDNTSDPLDLVPTSWDQPSGAPSIAIPLGIVTILGLRR